MKELSLNILDLTQNSITAGASLIEITVQEDTAQDTLVITLVDNGKGMTPQQVAAVSDPFYTTRTTRKVGLGIPLFKMAAEMAGGSCTISSTPGVGTTISADFVLSHIDRVPIGDMEGVVHDLVYMNPQLDFVYTRSKGQNSFVFDTRELREVLGDVAFNEPEVSVWITEYLTQLSTALNE